MACILRPEASMARSALRFTSTVTLTRSHVHRIENLSFSAGAKYQVHLLPQHSLSIRIPDFWFGIRRPVLRTLILIFTNDITTTTSAMSTLESLVQSLPAEPLRVRLRSYFHTGSWHPLHRQYLQAAKPSLNQPQNTIDLRESLLPPWRYPPRRE